MALDITGTVGVVFAQVLPTLMVLVVLRGVVVATILIGIMAVVLAEELVRMVVLQLVLVVLLLLEGVVAVGMIMVPALVKQPHRKDAITYLRQVAEADFIGTLVRVLVDRIAVHLLLRVVVLPAPLLPAHVRLDITG